MWKTWKVCCSQSIKTSPMLIACKTAELFAFFEGSTEHRLTIVFRYSTMTWRCPSTWLPFFPKRETYTCKEPPDFYHTFAYLLLHMKWFHHGLENTRTLWRTLLAHDPQLLGSAAEQLLVCHENSPLLAWPEEFLLVMESRRSCIRGDHISHSPSTEHYPSYCCWPSS